MRKSSFALLVVFVLGASTQGATAQSTIPNISGFSFTATDTSYAVAVTDTLTAFGVRLIPTDLTFRFTPGATASDHQMAMFGGVEGTFEGSTLTLTFGTTDNPGIMATGATLTTFAASISGTFESKALSFEASDAGFQWTGSDNQVGIYGTYTVTFDGEAVSAVLGEAESPGFVLDNGVVSAIIIDVPDPISLKGLPISPTDVGMAWSGTDDAFALWGSATISIDGSAWDVTMGDEASPGVTIDSGTLTALNMTVSGQLDLDGFSATAQDLSVAWDAAGNDVELNGTGTIALGSETLSFTLGDADDPGVSIQNGALQDLDLSLDGTLQAAGMDLVISDLTLIESGSNFFEAYGSVSVDIGGKSMALALGTDASNPGMVFNNGALTRFTASATGSITAESVDFTMDGLTVAWTSGGDFELYGSASVSLEGSSATFSGGDASDPGMKLHSGSLTHVNVGITGDFNLHGLDISPNGLTFEWDEGESKFFMYGELDVTFAGDTVDALLGTSDEPGFTLHNGSITEVNMGITSNLKVDGLHVKTNALTFEWTGGSDYNLYGDADLTIGNDNLDADFGNANDPGIQIRNGNLHSLSVDINSDIKLGNLEVETKDLTVDYSSSKFIVSGEITVTEVFEVDVSIGTSSNPGLEIDVSGSTPRFKIEDLTISVKHADLGGIDVKNITLEFTSSGVKDVEVDVAFPGGSEIGGELKFTGDPAKIDEVTIFYRADNLAEAIELFEGVQVAYISGTLGNLSKSVKVIPLFGIRYETKVTRSPYVSATLQTIYGGGVTFDGKSATFVEMSDELTVYDFGLSFSADVNVGAYRTSSSGNNWANVFGGGSVDVILDYSEYGFISGTVEMPFVQANASVFTDSHKDFDALVNVHFCFPHGSKYWPVSGKCFGSISGAVRYKHGYPYSSYGAGWTRVKTFWHTYHPGGKYNMGSKHFSFSLDLNTGSIESDIHRDESVGKRGTLGETYTHYVSTFELDSEEAHSLLVRMNWHEFIDSAYVTVIGPDGYHELIELFVAQDNGEGNEPDYGTNTNFDLVVSDSLANFFVTTATTIDTTTTINETLMPGEYSVYLSYLGEAEYDLDISVQPFVDGGSISVAGNMDEDARAIDLELDFWSARPDSTVISWYRSDSLAYNGRLIERQDSTNLFTAGNSGEALVSYQPEWQAGVDSLWFYAVLDDGANPMEFSDIIGPFVFEPDLRGTVVDSVPADSVAPGALIYVDNNNDGHWDTASTGGLEPHDVVPLDGGYAMNGLSEGTYILRVLLPDGYRLAEATDGENGIAITYANQPLVVNLTIEKSE